MATKKTTSRSSQQAPKAEAKDLTLYEQRMAELATQATESASSAGGTSASISTRGGRFSIDGAEVEGGTLEVVVLDFAHDVTYYQDDYDPDDIKPPTAFALGRKESELVWHENSHPDYAGELVKDSPVFQWGSADKGRGKAAKSKRRLLLISADDLEEDIIGAEVRKLTVPVTSAHKEWDVYVKSLAAHRRPPCGVLTEISIVPDPKSQFKLKFKMLGLIDTEHMPEVLQKVDSIQEELFAPYAAYDSQPDEEEDDRPAKGVARGAKARKPAAKGRR